MLFQKKNHFISFNVFSENLEQWIQGFAMSEKYNKKKNLHSNSGPERYEFRGQTNIIIII